MTLPDETLEIMAGYFKLTEDETEQFIEEVRAEQMELFFKSFLVYYEKTKTEAELMYLQKIADGFTHDFEKYSKKFFELIKIEVSANKEALEFISARVLKHISNIIYAFIEGKDRDTVERILLSLFEHEKLLELYQDSDQQLQ